MATINAFASLCVGVVAVAVFVLLFLSNIDKIIGFLRPDE